MCPPRFEPLLPGTCAGGKKEWLRDLFFLKKHRLPGGGKEIARGKKKEVLWK